MKIAYLGFLAVSLVFASTGFAQTAPFWSFDENNLEAPIPSQCDGQFDETLGGVFMPSPDEMYEQGELFLLEKGTAKNKAGYCFLAAAVQGNVNAQYRVAQLYNKGIVLPQNDLAAYKWAFVASLNGNKEAEQLALMLEQFLSAEDIELATKSVQTMIPQITQEKTMALGEQENQLKEKKEELERLNKEIDDMLGIRFVPPTPAVVSKESADSALKTDSKNIFSEKDRM